MLGTMPPSSFHLDRSLRRLALSAACALALLFAPGRGLPQSEAFDQELAASHSRQLKQIFTQSVVQVSTPEELQEAVLEGHHHIMVTRHLDLTAVPLRKNSVCQDGCDSPLPEIRVAKSITGNCSEPPTAEDIQVLSNTPGAAGLLPVQKDQCIIFTKEDIFNPLSPHVWFDNLYLRAVWHDAPTEQRWQSHITLSNVPDMPWYLEDVTTRFYTRMTFQGDGLGSTVGVWPHERTYVQNCTFANLGGDGQGCENCTAAISAGNTTVTVVNSTFFAPAPFPVSTYIRAWNGGRVLLSGCLFGPGPELSRSLFFTANAVIYSDSKEAIAIRSLNNSAPLSQSSPVSAIPAIPPDSNDAFLQRGNPWFVDLLEYLNTTVPARAAYPPPDQLPPALEAVATAEEASPAEAPAEAATETPAPDSVVFDPPPAAQPPEDTPANGSDSSDAPLTILAISVVLLAVMMACTCGMVLMSTLRDRRNGSVVAHVEPEAAGGVVGGVSPATANLLWLKGSQTHGADPNMHGEKNQQMQHFGGSTEGVRLGQRSIAPGPPQHGRSVLRPNGDETGQWNPHATFATASSWSSAQMHSGGMPPAAADRRPQAPGTPGDPGMSSLERLHEQLNDVTPTTAVLHRFNLLGRPHRVQGDQAVVAFATCIYDRHEYAVKFFTRHAAFAAERALRTSHSLHPILPSVLAIYDPEDDPTDDEGCGGGVSVPCIAMPRGESLEEWSQRARPDVFQAAAVLYQLAQQLREFHAAGYVHCAVEPAHILFFKSENRWTLTSFCRATLTGAAVSLPTRVASARAAPEVIAAGGSGYAAGSVTVVAAPALDAWGLGLVAYELLTSEQPPAAALSLNWQEPAALPWETSALTQDSLRKLGVFRKPVLSLLCREPAQRATMEAFCAACCAIVGSATTTTTV